MISTIRNALAATLMVVACGQAGAQISLPYDESGKLDSVDFRARTVVIDDSLYRLTGGLTVYSARGAVVNASALSPGQSVGFKYRRNVPGPDTVTDIWLLRGEASNGH